MDMFTKPLGKGSFENAAISCWVRVTLSILLPSRP